jgi:GTP-binding protein HflX
MRWAKKEAILVAREDDLTEAQNLLGSINVEVINTITLRPNYFPDPKTYVGKGKLNNLIRFVEDRRSDYLTLYIYDDLRPRQKVNLLKELKIPVKDKVELILEIFAEHAGSKEAKLQIEMAELLHTLPFVKEWMSRAKLSEFPGFMGPGKYAADAYYTHVKRRISRIRRELADLRRRREIERHLRRRRGIPHVAISGHANAGKTSLFNKITASSKPVSQKMFTTLTPKISTRSINGVKVAFVDTVGFVRKLPHEVIEAFYTTLEQITSSDLTLLVVDASEDWGLIKEKLISSLDTLSRIGYVGRELIVVVNKIDLTNDEGISTAIKVSDVLKDMYPWKWKIVRTSVLRNYGINWLIDEISESLGIKHEYLMPHHASKTAGG